MSGIAFDSTEKLTDYQQLVDYFHEGGKESQDHRIGVEFEAFLYCKKTMRRLQYDDGLVTLPQVLQELHRRHGWKLIEENGRVISATDGSSFIHFEPGGQIELSTGAYENVCDIYQAMLKYTGNLKEIGKDLGFGMTLVGVWPMEFPTNQLIIARDRYKILRQRLLQQKGLGPEMMTNSACIHVNLDYKSEEDMRAKFYVGLALQPFITVLCANSPFHGGEVKSDLCYRQRIWQDTDAARCDYLSFGLDPDMKFERYVDYAMAVPSIFMSREGKVLETGFAPFQDIFDGKLGLEATMADWENHLTTLFPSVRSKRHLELRGADILPTLEHIASLTAFWVGLFYDEQSLAGAQEYLRQFSKENFVDLDHLSPQSKLQDGFAHTTIQEVLQEMFKIAREGLNRRVPTGDCKNESKMLDPLARLLETGKSPAEHAREKYTPDSFKDYILDHSVF